MGNYYETEGAAISLALVDDDKTLLSTLRGIIVWHIYVINTLFFAVPLFSTAILKFIIPVKPWRNFCTLVLKWVANCWIFVNNLSSNTKFDVQGIERLSMKSWYLVVSNHQTWVDILILQRAFYRKIPFLKFFLKKGTSKNFFLESILY